MRPRVVSRAVLLGLAIAAVFVAPAAAVPVVDGEFPVSGLSSNNKLAAGPDGNVWITVDDATNDVAKITPSGMVEEFDLEATNPQGITAGPENSLWITRNGGVTKFSPSDPENSKDPTDIIEVLNFHSIVLGPDGNLWVATDNRLYKIPPGDPENETSFEVGGLSPRDIDAAGSLLAVSDFGGRVVTATTDPVPVVTDYPLKGGSQGVAGGPGGQIAFTQQAQTPTEFGLFTPPGPPVGIPSPETDPFGVAFGPDGAYWVAQFATDSLSRLATDGQTSSLGAFAAPGGPRQIAAGPGNTLWVTIEDPENDPDKVARVSGVDPPAAIPISGVQAKPQTRIVKGPKKKVRTKRKRARVKFRFNSPDAGARFECALVKVKNHRKGKPAPKPKFKGCQSPKAYRLKPGRYRFLVRAVLNGVADPSPARRVFRVIRIR